MKRKSVFLMLVVPAFLGSYWILQAQSASFDHGIQSVEPVGPVVVAPVDSRIVASEDSRHEKLGASYRFAVRKPMEVTPGKDGVWEALGDGTLLWRLPLVSPGAVSLSFGFSRYFMPPGGSLHIHSTDRAQLLGPFTNVDNKEHGQLWTPLIRSDSVTIELTIPSTQVSKLELELTSINHGYRDFTPPRLADGSGDSLLGIRGAEWEQRLGRIGAVGKFHVTRRDGTYAGTGVLVNNTARDKKPYFLTGFHLFDESPDLVLDEAEKAAARSVVMYWNSGASPSNLAGTAAGQRQSGATIRAACYAADFSLLELDDVPSATSEGYYAGWDRTKISSSDEIVSVLSAGSVNRVPSTSRFISLSAAWAGAGTPDTRLRDWLDPLGAERLFLDGMSITDEQCMDVTVGTEDFSWPFPLHGNPYASRTQVLYLADEIGQVGRITRLALDVTKTPAQVLENWTIRMKHISLGTWTQFDASGWTVVYQQNETIGTTGWHWFELQTPFEYDGKRNLLVDFSHNGLIYGSNGECRASQPGRISTISAEASNQHGDPLDWSGREGRSPTVSAFVPNLRLIVCPSCAEQDVGSGTLSWDYPLHAGSHDSRTQVIYLAGEIGRAGRMTQLALDVTKVPGQTLNRWTIRMKHTGVKAYDTCWLDAYDWTVVYQKDETIDATGWHWFQLQTPFEYDGKRNLLVDFSHDNASSTSSGQCRSSQPGGSRSICAYSDSGHGEPQDWFGTVASAACGVQVPNLRLVICQSAVQPTLRPSSPTQCPVVETQCPAEATKCPPVASQCQTVDTYCSSVDTKCPPVETRCPAEWTQCPTSSTRCPETATACRIINTECPAVSTSCPPVETECPSIVTICRGARTMCPITCPRANTAHDTSNSAPASVVARMSCPALDVSCPTFVTVKR